MGIIPIPPAPRPAIAGAPPPEDGLAEDSEVVTARPDTSDGSTGPPATVRPTAGAEGPDDGDDEEPEAAVEEPEAGVEGLVPEFPADVPVSARDGENVEEGVLDDEGDDSELPALDVWVLAALDFASRIIWRISAVETPRLELGVEGAAVLDGRLPIVPPTGETPEVPIAGVPPSIPDIIGAADDRDVSTAPGFGAAPVSPPIGAASGGLVGAADDTWVASSSADTSPEPSSISDFSVMPESSPSSLSSGPSSDNSASTVSDFASLTSPEPRTSVVITSSVRVANA